MASDPESMSALAEIIALWLISTTAVPNKIFFLQDISGSLGVSKVECKRVVYASGFGFEV